MQSSRACHPFLEPSPDGELETVLSVLRKIQKPEIGCFPHAVRSSAARMGSITQNPFFSGPPPPMMRCKVLVIGLTCPDPACAVFEGKASPYGWAGERKQRSTEV